MRPNSPSIDETITAIIQENNWSEAETRQMIGNYNRQETRRRTPGNQRCRFLIRALYSRGFKLTQIGNYFNRDHSTILHTCKEVKKQNRRAARPDADIDPIAQTVATENGWDLAALRVEKKGRSTIAIASKRYVLFHILENNGFHKKQIAGYFCISIDIVTRGLQVLQNRQEAEIVNRYSPQQANHSLRTPIGALAQKSPPPNRPAPTTYNNIKPVAVPVDGSPHQIPRIPLAQNHQNPPHRTPAAAAKPAQAQADFPLPIPKWLSPALQIVVAAPSFFVNEQEHKSRFAGMTDFYRDLYKTITDNKPEICATWTAAEWKQSSSAFQLKILQPALQECGYDRLAPEDLKEQSPLTIRAAYVQDICLAALAACLQPADYDVALVIKFSDPERAITWLHSKITTVLESTLEDLIGKPKKGFPALLELAKSKRQLTKE
jgi:hypothetical protein